MWYTFTHYKHRWHYYQAVVVVRQYLDLVKQNEWLRSNVLMLLATTCSAVIVCIMHLESRFSDLLDKGQWRDDSTVTTLRSMTKTEVEAEHLAQSIVMPQSCNMPFMAWWKTLSNSNNTVNVCYPHERHGLAGRLLMPLKWIQSMLSPASYISILNQMEEVQILLLLLHIVLPKFRTIQTPKTGCGQVRAASSTINSWWIQSGADKETNSYYIKWFCLRLAVTRETEICCLSSKVWLLRDLCKEEGIDPSQVDIIEQNSSNRISRWKSANTDWGWNCSTQ